jgi:hypothetical protein
MMEIGLLLWHMTIVRRHLTVGRLLHRDIARLRLTLLIARIKRVRH